jgi:hypothetical protein
MLRQEFDERDLGKRSSGDIISPPFGNSVTRGSVAAQKMASGETAYPTLCSPH